MYRTTKDQILKLRTEGKTYKEIAAILSCSKSTVAYYCGDGQKQKSAERIKELRVNNPILKKIDNFKSNKVVYDGCRHFQSGEGDKKPFNQKDVLNRFGESPICYLTGRKIDWNNSESFAFDHIKPRYLGGDGSLENLGLCCPEANHAKYKLPLEDFLVLCKEILEHNGFTVEKGSKAGFEPASSAECRRINHYYDLNI